MDRPNSQSSSFPPLKQPFQPKLQSIPSVSLIRNPFVSDSASQQVHSEQNNDNFNGAQLEETQEQMSQSSPFSDYKPVKSSDGNASFFAALPVLVSLPLMVIASDFSLPTAIATEYKFLLRIAVSILQVLFVLCASKLSAKLRLAEPSSVHISTELCLGLVLFYLASSILPSTRVSVVYFCLFVNPLNVAWPLSLLYDIHGAFQSSIADIGRVIIGYVALGCSFWLVGQNSKSRTPRGFAPPYFAIYISTVILSAVLFLAKSIDLPFLAISVATSTLILSSASHRLTTSKLNILVISLFSYSLECFVLRTRSFSLKDCAVCVGIPLLTRIDKLRTATMKTSDCSSEDVTQKPKMLREILAHSDTRAIFNFLMLNTAFMFVQLLYSFRSKSLGLLSDSLHMALDCASLALGLVAGVLSKNPVDSNSKFPFGLKNFEILAGFANGTLLVGISGSIIFEAIGRLAHPVALQQTTELIVVSILGLLVNIVGIFAFNHGHSHSHGHSHGHSHNTSHEDSHEHSHENSHGTSHDTSHEASHSHGHSHNHHNPAELNQTMSEACEDHGEMNDNMRGIFLHILADTLGSVGVVISTILTKIFHWQGFDPVASIIIASLIFMTALPLMKSTASTLLLKLDSRKEATVRSALNDLTLIKGIKSFTTPRFWPSSGKLGGFIHIQVYRGESTAYLKKQCEEVFRSHNIDALIQMENDFDPCWCRA